MVLADMESTMPSFITTSTSMLRLQWLASYPKILWVAACNFKDSDDLSIRVVGGLSGTWVVIKKRTDRFLQMGRIFCSNFLQKGKNVDKASPPFTDRIPPRPTCLDICMLLSPSETSRIIFARCTWRVGCVSYALT